jgi:hypothetical protein
MYLLLTPVTFCAGNDDTPALPGRRTRVSGRLLFRFNGIIFVVDGLLRGRIDLSVDRACDGSHHEEGFPANQLEESFRRVKFDCQIR